MPHRAVCTLQDPLPAHRQENTVCELSAPRWALAAEAAGMANTELLLNCWLLAPREWHLCILKLFTEL